MGQRSLELIEQPLSGSFDVVHLQRIHRYLFQDVYQWAGDFRTVDIAKGNSYFAHVPYIRSTLEDLFEKLSEEQHLRGLNQEAFARRAAEILGTLNAVHPFREGNGRTQRESVRELAHKNSYWVDWSKVSRQDLYEASDVSFMRGELTPDSRGSVTAIKLPSTDPNPDKSRATDSAHDQNHLVDSLRFS